jgi:thymidylate synthase
MYILEDYDKHLLAILRDGEVNSNRTITDTFNLFGLQSCYKINKVFPIPTKRKYPYKSIFAELLWMLSGSTNINDLEKMNSKIWTPWRDKAFEERNGYADGELGPIYGWQFRHSGGDYNLRHSNPGGVDQVAYVVDQLRNNKLSRRILINLWNPTDMLSDKVKLPCCHYSFQLLVDNRDRLTGILTQRSGDWLPGVSANIVFYSAFIYLLAQQCNLRPYQLIHNVSNAHIYVDQGGAADEYLQRPVIDSPTLIIEPAKDIFSYTLDHFKVENYQCGEPIKIPVAV